MDINNKLNLLKNNLNNLKSAIVAFSGGVDSTFLLKVAYDVLGDKVLAITAKSCTFPEREFNEALSFIALNKIPHRVVETDELAIAGFAENPLNRCYLCKMELFEKMKQIANDDGYNYVIEGSNVDDLGDYRPGLQAIKELNIQSPLREAGMTKEDIRYLSKKMCLNTWDKPSFACLSSRFPYSEIITIEKLKMVERAEQFLIDKGFKQVRVRIHGEIARIEVIEEDISKFIEPKFRDIIHTKFRDLGFAYIALDLKGYRTGSMNESFHKTDNSLV